MGLYYLLSVAVFNKSKTKVYSHADGSIPVLLVNPSEMKSKGCMTLQQHQSLLWTWICTSLFRECHWRADMASTTYPLWAHPCLGGRVIGWVPVGFFNIFVDTTFSNFWCMERTHLWLPAVIVQPFFPVYVLRLNSLKIVFGRGQKKKVPNLQNFTFVFWFIPFPYY